MKRTILIITLALVVVLSLSAQIATNTDDIAWTACFQKSCYGSVWNNSVQQHLMLPVAKNLTVGCGFIYEFATYYEPRRDDISLSKLNAFRKDIGVIVNVQYQLWRHKDLSNAINLQLSAKYMKLGFEGDDPHAVHIVEDEDGCPETFTTYTLWPQIGSWGTKFMPTIRLTYNFDFKIFHFEFGIGYDLLKSIDKQYLEAPTHLTSSWDDFETYYPNMVINPFTEFECGKKLVKYNGFHLVLGIGVRITGRIMKGQP